MLLQHYPIYNKETNVLLKYFKEIFNDFNTFPETGIVQCLESSFRVTQIMCPQVNKTSHHTDKTGAPLDVRGMIIYTNHLHVFGTFWSETDLFCFWTLKSRIRITFSIFNNILKKGFILLNKKGKFKFFIDDHDMFSKS